LQGPPQIAGSVQHTDDFRPVIQRTIKNDVSTEGQAAQPWYKLIAGPAHKRMHGEQLTTLLYSLNEPRGVGRIVARYEVANFDEIALGALREAQLRHASAAQEPRFQPGKYILPFADPSRREIIKSRLQVALQRRQFFRLGLRGLDGDGEARTGRGTFWKAVEYALWKLRGCYLDRERLQRLC